MTVNARIWIGLSGGVDSSVAALLLKEAGYAVEGVHLRLWEAPGQASSLLAAEAVAQALEIPLHVFDWRQSFRTEVVDAYLDALARNLTPNPCVRCNRLIKWGRLLEMARANGAEYLASGHYARLIREGDGQVRLYKALDQAKDQSYFLAGLPQEALKAMRLPLAELNKVQVRQMAQEDRLPTRKAVESEDLCFLAGQDQASFLREHAANLLNAGPITDRSGKLLGQHAGLALYTIGQRKGIGLAAPEPYYVLEKRAESNTLVVGWAGQLLKGAVLTGPVNWLVADPPEEQETVQVKIRSGARPALARCQILPSGDMIATLEKPLRDITAGQLLVLYRGDLCLGSAEIKAGLDQGTA